MGQALRSDGVLQRERQLLVQWEGWERHLLGLLATVLQDFGREVMPLEHPTDLPVVNSAPRAREHSAVV